MWPPVCAAVVMMPMFAFEYVYLACALLRLLLYVDAYENGMISGIGMYGRLKETTSPPHETLRLNEFLNLSADLFVGSIHPLIPS